MKNFSLIGASGYIAPRHLKAIRDTNNNLLCILDNSDCVGIIDSYFPNADFFHASAYFYLGIPTKLFTPIFVMSRVTGWTAHCMEQRANNRIIRPSAEYTGPETSVWVDLEDRE